MLANLRVESRRGSSGWIGRCPVLGAVVLLSMVGMGRAVAPSAPQGPDPSAPDSRASIGAESAGPRARLSGVQDPEHNAPRRADDPRPDLVLVLSDDQRYDTLGCTGSTILATPHLDRLAAEGALFTNATVTVSKCCPSRAALLTGRDPASVGVLGNEPDPAVFGEATLFPALLQEAGYETAFIGKWHLPNPGAQPVAGFDYWVSFEGHGRYFGQSLNVNGKRVASNGHLADDLTNHALDWLARPRHKPVLLFLSLKNCHSPYLPPERHTDALAGAEIRLPESFRDPLESLPAPVQDLRQRDKTKNQHEKPELYIESLRKYLTMVLSVDDNVGRLRTFLEERDSLDRTLFVFTSDNGFFMGEHGLIQKGNPFEPALRIPLIARFPQRIRAGSEIARPVLLRDVTATLLDAASVEIPTSMVGASVLSLGLDVEPGGGKPASSMWREHTLHYAAKRPNYEGPQEFVLRGPRYKYFRFRTGEVVEALYDLHEDPDERVNLAESPEHAERLAVLRDQTHAAMAEAGMPEAWWNADPKVERKKHGAVGD